MNWLERIPTLSINPDMATKEDVARLASELMEARHKLQRLSEIIGNMHREVDAIVEYILSR